MSKREDDEQIHKQVWTGILAAAAGVALWCGLMYWVYWVVTS